MSHILIEKDHKYEDFLSQSIYNQINCAIVDLNNKFIIITYKYKVSNIIIKKDIKYIKLNFSKNNYMLALLIIYEYLYISLNYNKYDEIHLNLFINKQFVKYLVNDKLEICVFIKICKEFLKDDNEIYLKMNNKKIIKYFSNIIVFPQQFEEDESELRKIILNVKCPIS